MGKNEVSTRVTITGVGALLVIGVLALHLPRYLAAGTGMSGYAGWPGTLLAAHAGLCGAAAAGLIARRRWSWVLGTCCAAAVLVLYFAQETGWLIGLEQSWWEPTRLLALSCAAGFAVLAARVLSPT